uniref:SCP domain-containing protein n=1 Tax=Gadus morhua TaxID=8049 RepID=A0A8C5C3Q6_GADMO
IETNPPPCSTLTCWFPLPGHFTKLVWKETTEVGVGLATDGKRVFVVAQYRPAGDPSQYDRSKTRATHIARTPKPNLYKQFTNSVNVAI